MQNNAEELKLIDSYERLFAQEGWKELVEDFREKREQAKETLVRSSNSSERDLHIIQGQVSVWDYVISLERTVEAIKLQQASLPDVQ